MKFLITFLLFPVLLFAQNDFDRGPLKGKIISYTIARMYGDSLNPKSAKERDITYDDKGRLLTSFEKDTRSYSTAEQEQLKGQTEPKTEVTKYKREIVYLK